MMDIKEIAEQVSKRIYVEDGLLLSKFISEKFAEALIAEIAKQNEPVAWYDGNKFYANETSAFCGCADLENLRPVFTFPPTAEQIANETAEACAKACEDVIGNTPRDQRMLAAIDCAVMLRSGAWKEFKK